MSETSEYPFLTDEERCTNWLPDNVSHFGDMRCAGLKGHDDHRKHYFGPVTWNPAAGEWRTAPVPVAAPDEEE